VSPIQFQKRLRLHEARQMLLSTRHDVAEIGVATGYSSPSQFNRDYQREFGTAPGRDRAIKLDERDGRVTSLPSSE
jgi:transcriptional regulator GlxA family with amidase domain